MTLGEKITKLRKKENLTQEKLALQLGITRQTLSNWESDITSPNIIEAKKIATMFQISLDDLLELDIHFKTHPSIFDDLVGKQCYIELLEEDYKINDDTLCKVLQIEGNFIKIEFEYGKETFTKLIDLELVSTIRREIKNEWNG